MLVCSQLVQSESLPAKNATRIFKSSAWSSLQVCLKYENVSAVLISQGCCAAAPEQATLEKIALLAMKR